MSSGSIRPQPGQNPNYFAGTTGADSGNPHPLQSNPPSGQPSSSYQPQPCQPGQYQPYQQGQYQQPYYPPPPQQQSQQHQPYFLPPPTGPYQGQGQSQQQPPTASDGSTPQYASSKPTFGERLYQWGVKAGVPINRVTNRLGSEAFWPSTMDVECDKAARILKSFCKDGFFTTATHVDGVAAPAQPGSSPGPKNRPKVLVKIPQKAIQSAAGLAIFTTFRTGLHISGAGGSGIVVSRLPDGSWSPPSGFLVHTLGAGFMIGLDIYDCVCLLRTLEAVRAFTHPRLALGGEIGLAAGPVGAGSSVEAALGRSTKPIWSYMKSRGLYAGVQADGTIVVGRPDANAAFYGEKGITIDRILRGDVPAQGGMWPQGAGHLMEVLKAADGRGGVDENVMREVSAGPTPGDLGIGDGEREVHIPEDQK